MNLEFFKMVFLFFNTQFLFIAYINVAATTVWHAQTNIVIQMYRK
jgi:hypothetical protein